MSAGELTLYELGWETDKGPALSPHSYKARLALVAKGVPFTSKYTTYEELQSTIKAETGNNRPRAPFLVLPTGERLFDSLEIARWLDTAYPSTPSVFLPSSPGPCDPSSPSYQTALNYSKAASVWQYGWQPLMKLGMRQTTARAVEGSFSKAYFKQNRFWGDELPEDGEALWEKFCGIDRAEAIAEGKVYLSRYAHVLEEGDFLTSPTHPGFVDFVLVGQFAHCLLAGDPDAMGCWKADKRIVDWVERMLDAFDGHLREHLAPFLKNW